MARGSEDRDLSQVGRPDRNAPAQHLPHSAAVAVALSVQASSCVPIGVGSTRHRAPRWLLWEYERLGWALIMRS